MENGLCPSYPLIKSCLAYKILEGSQKTAKLTHAAEQCDGSDCGFTSNEAPQLLKFNAVSRQILNVWHYGVKSYAHVIEESGLLSVYLY